MLKSYLKGIFDTGKRGDAREESYYETLAALLRKAATSSGKSKFHITTLPKRNQIQQDENWADKIEKCLYRPFDIRWIFYHRHAIDRKREEVMRHILHKDDIALLISRRASKFWQHAYIAENITVDVAISSASREGNQVFPLYLYPDLEKRNLFSEQEQAKGKTPNINSEPLAQLSGVYPELTSSEMIFYYIYSVLYSETYRKKYAEFLKTDFPRIPFTKDYDLFRKMAEYGQQLVDLHLMNSPDLDSPIARFQGSGDERVDKLRYDDKDHRVYINKDQYFENIEEDIWQYHIGGYQVCNK